MGSTIIVRHECDRCHHTVEALDDIRKPTDPPDGWMMISISGQARLMCDKCLDGLRAFMRENEAAEQSR